MRKIAKKELRDFIEDSERITCEVDAWLFETLIQCYHAYRAVDSQTVRCQQYVCLMTASPKIKIDGEVERYGTFESTNGAFDNNSRDAVKWAFARIFDKAQNSHFYEKIKNAFERGAKIELASYYE